MIRTISDGQKCWKVEHMVELLDNLRPHLHAQEFKEGPLRILTQTVTSPTQGSLLSQIKVQISKVEMASI